MKYGKIAEREKKEETLTTCQDPHNFTGYHKE